MHVPRFGVGAVGPSEIASKAFGLLAPSGIRHRLVEIREFGTYVSCFRRVSDGGKEWNAVGVFRFDEQGRVADIWAW